MDMYRFQQVYSQMSGPRQIRPRELPLADTHDWETRGFSFVVVGDFVLSTPGSRRLLRRPHQPGGYRGRRRSRHRVGHVLSQ